MPLAARLSEFSTSKGVITMKNFDYSNINLEDVIQVEDLTDRIEELEDCQNDDGIIEDEDEAKEFEALKSLIDDLQGMGGDHQWRGDWYPASLIRDSYFNDAMDELVEDIGDIPKDLPCYLSITVDYVALQQDYSSVEVNGVTYWCR